MRSYKYLIYFTYIQSVIASENNHEIITDFILHGSYVKYGPFILCRNSNLNWIRKFATAFQRKCEKLFHWPALIKDRMRCDSRFYHIRNSMRAFWQEELYKGFFVTKIISVIALWLLKTNLTKQTSGSDNALRENPLKFLYKNS